MWDAADRETIGTVHIYSLHNDTRQGYEAYKLQDAKKIRKFKAGTTLRAATDRAMTRKAPTAAWLNKQKEDSQPEPSGSDSQPQTGNPGADNNKQAASNTPAGQLSDGTPCYWSANARSYYRYNNKGEKKSVKATDVRSARSTAAASAHRPSTTGGHDGAPKQRPSTTGGQGSAAKQRLSTTGGHGSAPKQRPSGHLKDGTPYFYSERQGKYYTIASDGSHKLLSTK